MNYIEFEGNFRTWLRDRLLSPDLKHQTCLPNC